MGSEGWGVLEEGGDKKWKRRGEEIEIMLIFTIYDQSRGSAGA